MPRCLALLLGFILLTGCAGPRSYEYHFIRGKTAILRDGIATAPKNAPPQVHAAIAAGNEIAGSSYQYGGGHGGRSGGFDCSGATSYVLNAAGVFQGSTTSEGFRKFGRSGEGKWISVYARRGHVFLVIAGLRFDTGWTGMPEGPRWTTKSRPAVRYVVRHPAGL